LRCPETDLRCPEAVCRCFEDGRMTYRNRLTGEGCKPVYAAENGNVLVINDILKGSKSCQVWIRKMNGSELFFQSLTLCR
jgi:hypothetical protein